MAEDLSEIVEACNEMSADELAEPSLESENAYQNESVELDDEQKNAIDRITGDN
jgi:hypothetical protein